MEHEFDPAKDAANLEKHGLRLSFGVRVLEDPCGRRAASHRPVDGERRYKAIGLVEGRLYTAIYTWRGVVIRFISVRRSNNGEERAYRHPG